MKNLNKKGETMEIISMSLDEEMLKQLNAIQEKFGFKSRSKMLRNAVLGMVKDYQVLDSLKGNVEAIFVITYKQTEKNHVSDILHKFEDMIKTELHQHNSGICVDILNISGSAQNVRELFGMMKRNRSVYSVTYSIINKAS